MTSWHLSRFAAVAIICATVAALSNCSRVLLATLNAPAYIGMYKRHADIPYGTGARHSLDVYVPWGAEHRPVVVFWYGGTWVKGTKEWYRFVGASLASSGYVAVLPDYRLYPQVHFPEFIQDGAQAVRWTREHVGELGGDPNAIFLMGHSAGAHLAATLALDPRYLRAAGVDTKWIRGWIGLSGPYALDTRIAGYPILRDIFRKPYAPTDWQLIDHVQGHLPPALLIHGTNDIFPDDVIMMDRKLRSAGNYVECRIYDQASHTDTVSAFSLPLRFEAPSLGDVRRFIDRTLADPRIVGGTAVGTPCPELRIDGWWNKLELANR